MSNVIKRFIQFTRVIIGVRSFQRYIKSSSYTGISQLAHYILRYETQHRKHNGRTTSFGAIHASNTHKLNVSVAPLTDMQRESDP